MSKILVPTGYMGSGSSAVTDFLSEFSDVSNEYKSYEYVFLHCPNGLFDLEDKLLIGNNAIRSDEAIRTFEEQMKKLYDKKYWWVGNYKKIIGPDFYNLTKNFINEITNFNFSGYWYMHEEVNNKMLLKLIIRKPFKMITNNKFFNKKILRYNDGMRISLISSKNFYDAASKYIANVLEKITKDKKNVILDQLLLPFNLFRIDNYFNDNLKVIVVERDPRDVYILNKYIWPQKNYEVPMPKEAKEFCAFYKSMRESEHLSTSKKILRIRFEDLIYNYEKTSEKITKFVGFKKEDHEFPLKRFNPTISIKNTQLFRKSEYLEEIKIIEKELKAYLYNFPYVINNDVKNTVEFE